MAHFLDIIIPEYNCKEEFIKRLLHSISRQKNVDFGEIGVIIVNDNSKNKLRKGIFKNYPKLDIKYYLKDINEGVGMTRQYGLDRSDATYVTFWDQDDEFYESNSLGKIIKFLKKTDINYLCTDFIEEVITNIGTIELKQFDKSDGRETLHGVFIKREFLNSNNIKFAPGYRVHDDFYLKRIMSSIETPVYIKDVVYLWKYNESSQVRKKRKYNYLVDTFDEYFRVTKATNEFLLKNNRYNSINMVSSIMGLYIILDSNYFDLPELQEKKHNYEYEFLKYVIECNEVIESIKSEFDLIQDMQFNLMKNSNPDLVIKHNFKEYIDFLLELFPDLSYKNIKSNRFLDIIIPYYNANDKTIESLMNSILRQKNISLNEIGVIFVSDKSPNDIPNYVLDGKKYPIINIEYFKKDKNEGQGLTRQYGFDRSKAKYVTYLDQDDMLFGPDALSIVISKLKENSPEVLFTDYFWYKPNTGERRIITYKELLCLHGVFFEREKVIEKKLKFSDKFRMYEDTYYMIIANRVLDAKYINYPTYIWIANENSQTSTLNNGSIMIVDKFDDYFLANTEAIKFLYENGYKDDALAKDILYTLFGYLHSNLFEENDISNHEKKLYDYYLYLASKMEFKDEKENIDRTINNLKIDRIKEMNMSFDEYLDNMKKKYN